MTDKQTTYKQAAQSAMEKCQFLEDNLRSYLTLVMRLAKLTLQPYVPVDVSEDDFCKLPLGKLIGLFEKFNGNSCLIAELKRIVPDRNFVAHQSLLFTLGELEDESHMQQITAGIATIATSADKAHEAVLDESNKLRKTLLTLERKAKN